MCAKVEPPGGGPDDKKPPEIISVMPSAGSVNVSLEPELEILFSERMERETTEKAIFLSPLLFDYTEFEWSGKKLSIKLPEKLKENTTYVLTVGALAVDNHGNKLGQSQSFPFSTGQAIITNTIAGRVLSTGARTIDAWAYKLDSPTPGMFWMDIPDYITQTDSLGEFQFEYLSYGIYLVVAVEDKNKDQFWTPPSEKIAFPDTLIKLNENAVEYKPLFMVVGEYDTLQPYLSKVESPDNRKVIIEFSHQMDKNNVLLKSNYRIENVEDSILTIPVVDIYPYTDDEKTIILDCPALVVGNKYKLTAVNLYSIYKIAADTLMQIFEAGDMDTTSPEIIKISPKPGPRPLPTGFDIKIGFSEACDTTNIAQKVLLSDTLKVPVSCELLWEYPNLLVVKPDFQSGGTYLFSMDEPNIFDLVGNPLGDTIKIYKYYTAFEDTFGQISGQVASPPGSNVIVEAIAENGESTTTYSAEDGKFKFDRLFPGTYIIKGFCDADHNGHYSGGQIKPFRFAEHIILHIDSVTVRARWETDIGVLDFKSSSD
jgi:hypothetical protein